MLSHSFLPKVPGNPKLSLRREEQRVLPNLTRVYYSSATEQIHEVHWRGAARVTVDLGCKRENGTSGFEQEVV